MALCKCCGCHGYIGGAEETTGQGEYGADDKKVF